MAMKKLTCTLLYAGALGALTACHSQPEPSQPTPKVAAKVSRPVASAPAKNKINNGVLQSSTVEPSPVFDEQYHGPDQGSAESVNALFVRGYVESALRETMLAAVKKQYPLLTLRDVRLTDPVSKFVSQPSSLAIAHDYIKVGMTRRLGGSLTETKWQSIWQKLPQQGSVGDWAKQLKRAMARAN